MKALILNEEKHGLEDVPFKLKNVYQYQPVVFYHTKIKGEIYTRYLIPKAIIVLLCKVLLDYCAFVAK